MITKKEDTEKCTLGETSPGRRWLVCDLYSSVYAGKKRKREKKKKEKRGVGTYLAMG